MEPRQASPRASFDPTVYHPEPPLDLTPAKEQDFAALARLVRASQGAPVAYPLAHPKHEFLRWLTEREGFLLHGSNAGTIDLFEPRRQGDAFDRPITAVFASADPIWPMFFAVLDRSRFRCTCNDCLATRAGTLYRFAVDRPTFEASPWTDGWVYVLERDGFARTTADNGRETEEWTRPTPARPVARIAVAPADFPFLSEVGPVDYTGEPTRVDAAFEALARRATAVEELPQGFAYALPGDEEGRAVAAEVAGALAEHGPLPGLGVQVREGPVVLLTGPALAKEAIRSLTERVRPRP